MMGIFKNLFGRKSNRGGVFGQTQNTNFNQVSFSKWNPLLRPPISIQRDYHERWVARCRDIVDNDSYGFGIMTTFHENVVTQNGIQIQNVADDQDFANTIDMEWRKWSESKMSSLSMSMDLVQMQRQAVTAMLSDGEVFVRKHFTRDGFKWELIDPARIPYALVTRGRAKQRYRNGILVQDDTGALLGYRVDDVSVENYRLGSTTNETRGVFVPQDEMLHVAIKPRIDQMRGTPLLRSVAGRIWKISSYEAAVLDNAIASSRKYGFLKWDKDSESPPDLEVNFKPSKEESGSFFELPPGLEVDSYQSPFPDDELGGFVRAILLAVARAIGVSYPTLSGDLSDVSYSGIRQAVLAERAVWKAFSRFLYQELLLPLYECFFIDCLAMGKLRVNGRVLSLTDLPEVMRVVMATVPFAEIDPKNEQIAETGRIQNMLVAPSEVIRQRGGDPDQCWAQVAKDIAAMKAAGIPEEYINSLFLKQPMAAEILSNVSDMMEENNGESG